MVEGGLMKTLKYKKDIPLSCSVYTKSKKAHINTKRRKNIDIACRTNYRHDPTAKEVGPKCTWIKISNTNCMAASMSQTR